MLDYLISNVTTILEILTVGILLLGLYKKKQSQIDEVRTSYLDFESSLLHIKDNIKNTQIIANKTEEYYENKFSIKVIKSVKKFSFLKNTKDYNEKLKNISHSIKNIVTLICNKESNTELIDKERELILAQIPIVETYVKDEYKKSLKIYKYSLYVIVIIIVSVFIGVTLYFMNSYKLHNYYLKEYERIYNQEYLRFETATLEIKNKIEALNMHSVLAHSNYTENDIYVNSFNCLLYTFIDDHTQCTHFTNELKKSQTELIMLLNNIITDYKNGMLSTNMYSESLKEYEDKQNKIFAKYNITHGDMLERAKISFLYTLQTFINFVDAQYNVSS